MRNLLTKTLFISLLSSVVVLPGAQAGPATAGGKKLARVALGAGVGIMVIGVGDTLGVTRDKRRTVQAIKSVLVFATGAATGVAVGGGTVGEIIATGVGEILGVGTAFATGTLLGKILKARGLRVPQATRNRITALVVLGGPVVGVAVERRTKLIEKYFSRKTAAGETIGNAS